MNLAKLAVLAIALVLAFGGLAAVLTDWGEANPGTAIQLVDDARKNEVDDEVGVVGDDDDDDDGDNTAGNDGTNGGNNTGDGDRTAGNDGTNGGNNTYAPSGGGDTDDGGSGGGGTTG
jgi:hypothetical protein